MTKAVLLSDGFRVSYRTYGDKAFGVPLVFLHGLSVSSLAYEELLERLGQLGFYVIAPDAPNHGGSCSLPWGHSVTDIADRINEFCLTLDISSAVFVGHSMGGAILVELADIQPDLFNALILVDAAVGPEFHETIRRVTPTRAAQWFTAVLEDVAADGWLAMKVRDGRERLSLFSRLRQSVSSFRFVKAAYALWKWDSNLPLQKLRLSGIPTIVMHGLLDGIVPWQSGRSAANLAGATMLTIPDGFHSWLVADPETGADCIATAAGWFMP